MSPKPDVLWVLLWCLLPVHPLDAQTATVEERLTLLERQVQELRALQGLAARPAELPAELAGNEHVRWGYPGGRCTLLVKEFYVVCSDLRRKVPEWVTYHLTRETLQGDAVRTDDFRPDPELAPGERAELEAYRNSGYDRGHMAPAADFKRSPAAMSATFLLSNMAPQRPNLNRRMWEHLERDVRQLAGAHGSLWIFIGALYLDAAAEHAVAPTDFIGAARVAVPTHFFKVILCEHASGTHEMFAFLMPNHLEPLTGQPRDYAVSVDRVEALSALNFFSALPDAEEDRLEALVVAHWPTP